MKRQIRCMIAAVTLSVMAWQPACAQQVAPAPASVNAKVPLAFRAVILSKLPPEKLAMYKGAIAQIRAKNKPLYAQINKLQDDLSPLLTADKFDKTAYMAKVAEIDKLYAQTRANTSEALVGIFEKFTPDERKVIDSLHRTRGAPSVGGQPSNNNAGQ